MGTFRTLVVLGAGVVIGGAALIVYRISQDTGKPLQEALTDVPGEARRLFADLKGRAGEAIERGREIYDAKQDAYREEFEEEPAAQ